MRNYEIVSTDSHLEVPPDSWRPFVDPEFREYAPKVVKLPNGGDAWLMPGKENPCCSASTSRPAGASRTSRPRESRTPTGSSARAGIFPTRRAGTCSRVSAGFQIDRFGLQVSPQCNAIGPTRAKVIDEQFAEIPDDGRQKIVRDNAVRYFHLDRA